MHNLSFHLSDSPIGEMLLVANDDSLISIYFSDTIIIEDKLMNLQTLYKGKIINKQNEILKDTQLQLKSYFKKQSTTFSIPLLLDGTDFQKSVWQALQHIPFAKTKSYSEVANLIDNPKAIRATGSAVGANKINIIIPCHRVIHNDGKIGQYGGNTVNINRKKYLLDLESR